MNTKIEQIKPIEKKAGSSNSQPPKLSVQAIVEKFVKPSTHRKFVSLSAPEANKK